MDMLGAVFTMLDDNIRPPSKKLLAKENATEFMS